MSTSAQDLFDQEAPPPLPDDNAVAISFETCEEVANLVWRNDQLETWPVFQNTAAIRIAHRGIPRAGHSNNIMHLITGNQEQASDYFKGLLVSSIIILCFFLVWIALLVTLRCLGNKRVGWLSGRRQKLPPKPPTQEHFAMTGIEPQTDDLAKTVMEAEQQENTDPPQESSTDSNKPPETMQEWDELYHKKIKQQRWMKGVVIVSCLMVIAMAVLMATKGVRSLEGSLDYGKVSINYAAYLLEGGSQVVAFLSNFLKQFQTDMKKLLNETNTVCPTVQPFLCGDLADVTTCNTTQIFDDKFADAFENLVGVFGRDWEITKRLDSLVEDLEDMQNTADRANNQLSTIDWVFYVAVVFDLLVGLLAAGMILHLLFPKLPWILKCIQNRFLFPLFLVFVLFSFIFAIAFLIASLALADTCADDPDERILDIADYFLKDRQAYVNDVVRAWLSQCNVPPPSIERDASILEEINTWLDRFAEAVNAANDRLVNVCGTPNPDYFSTVAGTLAGYVCASVGILWQLKEAFECNTWLPLYYNTVYNAMCYNGTDGVWSIAASQFVTTFFAAIILTCRCVFFELQVEGVDDKGEEETEDKDALADKDDEVQGSMEQAADQQQLEDNKSEDLEA
jgi:hypothetical protein